MYTNFYLFLGSVILVSISGVIMPGPVFAVSIAKGHRDGLAGSLIVLGHGILEFPLMLLIFLGFSKYFTTTLAWRLVSTLGGAMLVYMGVKTFQARGEVSAKGSDLPYGSVAAGLFTTGSNPYFYLWWSTAGAALIANASIFGAMGFAVFAFVHWLCDLAWYSFVSMATFRSRKFWTETTHKVVFGLCGFFLVALGGWFVGSALF